METSWDNNESFNIPQQRNAPTKDCKEKAKVHYNFSSRKLKAKRSDWSEESSTSEEFDAGQIFFCTRDLSIRFSVLAMKKNSSCSKKSLQNRLVLLDALTTSVVRDCEWWDWRI